MIPLGYSNIRRFGNNGNSSPLPERHIGSWSWWENGLPLPPAHLWATAEQVFSIFMSKCTTKVWEGYQWWPSGLGTMSNAILDSRPGTSWWCSHWWGQGIWGPATWQITTPHLSMIITWIFPPPERSREQCGDSFWSGQETYGVENFRWLLTPGNISHLLKNYNLSRKPVTR